MCSILDEVFEARDFHLLLKLLKENSETTSLIQSEHIEILLEKLRLEVECRVITDILAVIARNEFKRCLLVGKGTIQSLFEVINKETFCSEVALNALRTIANVCYENDKHREVILSLNGLDVVTDYIIFVNEKANLESLYHTVASGLLCNLCADNEKIVKELLRKSFLKELLKLPFHPKADHETFSKCLHILTYHEFMLREFARKENLEKILNCFEVGKGSSLYTELIHLLNLIIHNESLLNIINDEFGISALISFGEDYAACDKRRRTFMLAASLLSLDCFINSSYLEENRNVVQLLKGWCWDEDSEVRCAGALALGNLARSDHNAYLLAEDGVISLLTSMLTSNYVKEQHSILSALRNLAIPEKNKSAVVKAGTLELIGKYLADSAFPAVLQLSISIIKSLCLYAPTCKEVLKKPQILSTLEKWAKHDDEEIKSESIRIFSFIMRTSLSESAYNELKKYGAVALVIELLNSRFEVLKNDALLALQAVARYDDSILVDSMNLDKYIWEIVKGTKCDEMRSNAFSLALVILSQRDPRASANEYTEWKLCAEKYVKSTHKGLRSSVTVLLQLISLKVSSLTQ